MYVSIFWTAKYERKSCLNWIEVSIQVLPRSQLIWSTSWFGGSHSYKTNQTTLLNSSFWKLFNTKHEWPIHNDLCYCIFAQLQHSNSPHTHIHTHLHHCNYSIWSKDPKLREDPRVHFFQRLWFSHKSQNKMATSKMVMKSCLNFIRRKNLITLKKRKGGKESI